MYVGILEEEGWWVGFVDGRCRSQMGLANGFLNSQPDIQFDKN